MNIVKHTFSFSSDTATWEYAKRIKKSAYIVGQLLEVQISVADSTAKGLKLYRGTTTPGNLMLNAVRSKTSAVAYAPRRAWIEASTAVPSVKASTGAIRFPWSFADDQVIVCGATQKAGVVTLWIDGTVNKSTL